MDKTEQDNLLTTEEDEDEFYPLGFDFSFDISFSDLKDELMKIQAFTKDNGEYKNAWAVIDVLDKIQDELRKAEKELDWRKEALQRYKENLELSKKQVAYIKNVNEQTVNKWILDGLPIIQITSRGKVSIDPIKLDKWRAASSIR